MVSGYQPLRPYHLFFHEITITHEVTRLLARRAPQLNVFSWNENASFRSFTLRRTMMVFVGCRQLEAAYELQLRIIASNSERCQNHMRRTSCEMLGILFVWNVASESNYKAYGRTREGFSENTRLDVTGSAMLSWDGRFICSDSQWTFDISVLGR